MAINAKAVDGVLARGMLIYPRVNQDINERYEILGRHVSIVTVDLSKPWQRIDKELRQIFN